MNWISAPEKWLYGQKHIRDGIFTHRLTHNPAITGMVGDEMHGQALYKKAIQPPNHQAKRGSVFLLTVNGVYGSSVGAKYAQSEYPYHEPYKKWHVAEIQCALHQERHGSHVPYLAFRPVSQKIPQVRRYNGLPELHQI